MSRAELDAVRSFNRIVTQRIGALEDGYLARGRPLGASRLLWEIGPDGCDLATLRATLQLDSGYASRLLRDLEREGLIAVAPDATDRRRRTVQLTPDGDRERRELDRLSDELAASLLEPLDAERARELVEAMATVDRLLTAGMIRIEVEHPSTDAARRCIDSYFAELDTRFEGGFDPSVSISADVDDLTFPNGLLLVAWLRSEPVACGALKFHDDGTTELKRMWVSTSARGLGLGRRMLERLEDEARRRGGSIVRLETNRSLTEAITLYRSAGYQETDPFNDEPYAHHWFQKELA